MLEKIVDDQLQVKILHSGPSVPLLQGFAENLCREGYSKATTRIYIRAAERLICWSEREAISVSHLSEKLLERFDDYLDQSLRYSYSHRLNLLYGGRLFLKHLRKDGILIS